MGTLNRDDADLMVQAVNSKIESLVNQAVKNAPNDKETEGRVLSKNSDNTYTILVKNAKFTNIPQDRSLGEIATNTIVKVKIPNGQMTNAYICAVVDGTISKNCDCIFPVGHILLETSTTEPASLYGGTWYKLDAGYALWTATSGAVTVNSSGTITSGTISAGLPNITGTIGNFSSSFRSNGGAFYNWTTYSGNCPGGTWTGGGARAYFSASSSNSIYGNSSTVQPPAIKVYAWIRTA